MRRLAVTGVVAAAALALLTGFAGVAAQTTPPKPSPAATPTAKQPVVWSASAVPLAAAVGAKVSMKIAVSVAPGWHIYSLSQKPGGPTPLELTVAANQPFKLTGPIVGPKPELKFDEGFAMQVELITGRAEFALPVTVAKAPAGARTVAVEARYQACNDKLCLPAKTDRVDVPVVIK